MHLSSCYFQKKILIPEAIPRLMNLLNTCADPEDLDADLSPTFPLNADPVADPDPNLYFT